MENIEVFIERYDINSHSLIAHCKCVIDNVEYVTPSFNFQPYQLNVNSTQEMVRKIAELCLISLDGEIAKKQYIDNNDFLNELIQLEGKQFTFNADDLRPKPVVANLVLDNLEIEL